MGLDMWTIFGIAALALLVIGGISASLLAQRADLMHDSHGPAGDRHT